jgi:very-short-patch-repair endonuclease
MKSWDNLSENELDARKEQSRKNWENLDQNTKDNILKMANDAVRLASKTGSKLEKYLLNKLIKDSYKVDFHKEQTLSNTKLQIDLFLPSMNIAIEVDGPSHFEPVWGDDSLKRNKKYDNKKEGLITGKGWHLIRIKQKKDFSKSRADLIYIELISAINKTVGTNSSQKIVIEDK